MSTRRNRLFAVLGTVVVLALVVGLLAWRPWTSSGTGGTRSAMVDEAPSTTTTTTTAVTNRPSSAPAVVVDPEVVTEIEQNGSTTVLVSLSVTPTGTDAERAAQVRAAIDALVASMPPGSVTNVDTQIATVPVAIFTVDSVGLDALRARSTVVAVDANTRRSVIEEVGEVDVAAVMDAAVKATPEAGGSTALTPMAANTATDQIGAPAAWAAGWRGAGGVVAVLDSGVQSSHPYLSTGSGSKVIGEACFVTPGGLWGSPCPGGVSMGVDDPSTPGAGEPCAPAACSHGTHVAGIAAGGTGVTTSSQPSGVAPDARLVSIGVFAVNTSTAAIGAADIDIFHALQWLYNNRASFPGLAAVNLSLGSGSYTSYCDVVDAAYKLQFDQLLAVGIVTVVASGNNGYQTSVSSPSCVSSAVTVGAVDAADATTWFSNDGPQLDLMAPGTDILSSIPGGLMGMKNGTSMATPAVAGAIAMLRQPSAVSSVALLESTGPDVNASGFHTPRIAVAAATAALPGAPVAVAASVQAGHGDVTWSAPADVGTSPIVSYSVTASPGGATCTTASTTCALRGLQEGETYVFSVSATNASGRGRAAVSAPMVVPPPGPFMSFEPERFMDTRASGATIDDQYEATGAFGQGEWRSLTVAGRGSVPSTGVGAVALNVTAVNPTATLPAGWLAVAPTRVPDPPTTSNLNFKVGQTVANMVVSGLSPSGTIELYNSFGTTQVIVDVLGWFPDSGSFTGMTPRRLLDTRPGGATFDAVSQQQGPVINEGTVSVMVTDRAGVPASAGAVVVNVTAVNPSANGFVTVYPSDVSRPTTSNLNFVAGRTVPNLVMTEVALDGTITLFARFPNGVPADSVNLLVDVMGWFPATGSFEGLTPARLLDTRPSGVTIDGVSQGGGSLQNGGTRSTLVLGRGGVPATGVSAVAVNVTVVAPTASGFATVYAKATPSSPPPTASNLNFAAGQTVPNLVTADVAPDGTITVFVKFPSGAPADSAHVLIDVLGWFP